MGRPIGSVDSLGFSMSSAWFAMHMVDCTIAVGAHGEMHALLRLVSRVQGKMHDLMPLGCMVCCRWFVRFADVDSWRMVRCTTRDRWSVADMLGLVMVYNPKWSG